MRLGSVVVAHATGTVRARACLSRSCLCSAAWYLPVAHMWVGWAGSGGHWRWPPKRGVRWAGGTRSFCVVAAVAGAREGEAAARGAAV
eukprot:6737989-Prymnesium_polylepis.1